MTSPNEYTGYAPRAAKDLPPPTQRDLAGCVLMKFMDDGEELTLGNLAALCLQEGLTDPAEIDRLLEIVKAADRGIDLSAFLGPTLPPNPHRSLAEWARLPALTFHDAAKMLPNYAEGCIGILYGERSAGKTNVVLSLLFEAMALKPYPDMRPILYLAGEGAAGVGQQRIPAHIAASADEDASAWHAKGYKRSEAFEHRLYLHGRVPNLMHAEEVAATIKEFGQIRPGIVIIDTLATAIAGYDENSAEVSSQLTGNGTVAQIKDAWNCMVLIIAHQGKDVSRGVRGHSGLEGNADFLLHCVGDRAARTIMLECKKMRDGEDGHKTYWTYDAGCVPVPVKIAEHEYMQLAKPRSNEPGKDTSDRMEWAIPGRLQAWGIDDKLKGLTSRELGERWYPEAHGNCPGAPGDTDYQEWHNAQEALIAKIENAAKTKWAKDSHYVSAFRNGASRAAKVWYRPDPAAEVPF
jgi:hypothetical protein